MPAAAVCAVATPASANDASYFGDGATVFAVKDRRILMVSEKVTIRYDQAARDPAERWVAECVFTFRNTTDQPVEVQMGFPDWRPFGDAAGPGEWAIRAFAVRVAGAPVAAVHKAVASEPRDALPGQMDLGYDAAYTWKVAFAPGQTVVVENTYRFGGLSSNGPLSGCVSSEPPAQVDDVFWRVARAAPGGWDFENCLCRVIGYIVTTGNTWAGPIGEAEIAIQLPPEVWPHLVIPLPAASRIEDGWIRWRFRNWTPDRELKVVLARPIPSEHAHLPLFDTPAQARAWAAFAKKSGVAASVVRLLCRAYRVRHGVRATGALAPMVAAWERPEGVPATGRLSASEKEILKVLAALERELAPR